MKYQLVNVEAWSKKQKGFVLPPIERRTKLPVMGAARLIFLDPNGRHERIWVRVKLAVVDGQTLRYHGVVESSQPQLGLLAGDKVTFGPEHVAEIMHPLVEG